MILTVRRLSAVALLTLTGGVVVAPSALATRCSAKLLADQITAAEVAVAAKAGMVAASPPKVA